MTLLNCSLFCVVFLLLHFCTLFPNLIHADSKFIDDEWQLKGKGSNIYQYISFITDIITYKEILKKKSYLFFKTRFKIFF